MQNNDLENDRRRFFRIQDRVTLNYRVVQSANIEHEISKNGHIREQLSDLRNASHALDARLEVLNMKLAQDNPLVGEVLTLFHRKMALHERMLSLDSNDDRSFTPAKEVNLSASGIAFMAETPLNEGTYLKMEVITYPEHYYIPVFSRVVSCSQLDSSATSGYRIAVEFKGISNEDEEHIVNHIFKIQAQERRQEKAAQQNGLFQDEIAEQSSTA